MALYTALRRIYYAQESLNSTAIRFHSQNISGNLFISPIKTTELLSVGAIIKTFLMNNKLKLITCFGHFVCFQEMLSDNDCQFDYHNRLPHRCSCHIPMAYRLNVFSVLKPKHNRIHTEPFEMRAKISIQTIISRFSVLSKSKKKSRY